MQLDQVLRNRGEAFPLRLSGLKTPCRLCEDAGSIPGLAQWVLDQVLRGCGVGLQLQLRFDP